MEKLDFSDSYFTSNKMMPDPGDTLTLNWGRKMVKNMASAYGIIGTVNFNGGRGYFAMNMNFTRRFTLPPSVNLYYANIYGTIFGVPEYTPIWGEMLPMDSVNYDAGDAREKPYALISGDNLIIFTFTTGIHQVYYRIVGV